MKKIIILVFLIMLICSACNNKPVVTNIENDIGNSQTDKSESYKIANQEVLDLLSTDTIEIIELYMPTVREWYNTIDIDNPVDFLNDDVMELGENFFECVEYKNLIANPKDENAKTTYLCVNKAATVAYEISKLFLETSIEVDSSTGDIMTVNIDSSRWNNLLEMIDDADNYYLDKK